MDHTAGSGRVTNSTGNINRDGEILGYRGTGTATDPGRYRERPGLDERLSTSTVAVTPELADEQLAGVRRLLGVAR